MSDLKDKQNFWTTIPGILTGVAALLSAVTGLLVVMHHPAGTDTAAGHTEAAIVSGAQTGAATSTAPQTSSSALPIPKSGGDVTLTSRAGDVTKLPVKSFRHNYTEDAIQFKSGQSISFEKIQSIDFLNVNDDAHEVEVRVTLVDGRALEGQLATNYAFKGESDLGSFLIFVEDVKQIAFPRAGKL